MQSKLTGFDKHPTPFAAVKGYRAASWPVSYEIDWVLALCKNNPSEMLIEIYNADTDKMEAFEKCEFTYTYNDQGFPSTISLTENYLGASPTSYSFTYNYTYEAF